MQGKYMLSTRGVYSALEQISDDIQSQIFMGNTSVH